MTISFKTGDTLTIDCAWKDSGGNALSLDGVTPKCEMRLGFGDLVTLTTTVTSQANGEFRLSLTAAETDALSPGNYSADIQFTSDSLVESTETFTIQMVKDVTSA